MTRSHQVVIMLCIQVTMATRYWLLKLMVAMMMTVAYACYRELFSR